MLIGKSKDIVQQSYASFEDGMTGGLWCSIDPLLKVEAVVSHGSSLSAKIDPGRTCILIEPIFDFPIIQKPMAIVICCACFRLIMPAGSVREGDAMEVRNTTDT